MRGDLFCGKVSVEEGLGLWDLLVVLYIEFFRSY